MCYCIFRNLRNKPDEYVSITLEEYNKLINLKGDFLPFVNAAKVEDKDLEKCLMNILNLNEFKNSTVEFIRNQFWSICSTCIHLVYWRNKDELAFKFITTVLYEIEKNYPTISVDKLFPCEFGSKYIKQVKDFMFCIVFDWISYWTNYEKDKETYDKNFKETLNKPFVQMVLAEDKNELIKNAWNIENNKKENKFYTEFPTFN